MTASNLILLLQVLRGHGDVQPLIARGLEYSQIAELLREARSVGLIATLDSGDVLTEAGLRLLAESGKGRKSGEPGSWIRPSVEHQIPRLGEEEPFLPELPPRTHN
jgi:hypothetical protein